MLFFGHSGCNSEVDPEQRAILERAELDRRDAQIARNCVREVWAVDAAEISARHFHESLVGELVEKGEADDTIDDVIAGVLGPSRPSSTSHQATELHTTRSASESDSMKSMVILATIAYLPGWS